MALNVNVSSECPGQPGQRERFAFFQAAVYDAFVLMIIITIYEKIRVREGTQREEKILGAGRFGGLPTNFISSDSDHIYLYKS